jgi:hypothetical protein
MRRRFGFLAWVALTCGIVSGCGGGDGAVNTGPAGDNRSAQEKETDELLEKSRLEYNKKLRR